ncbi:hypothetical protein B5X24_HaOG210488 [Helicoverpa armigera]|nr:hypothetical protein B5X24_HaOG210488 [Helicoverpa armigera]
MKFIFLLQILLVKTQFSSGILILESCLRISFTFVKEEPCPGTDSKSDNLTRTSPEGKDETKEAPMSEE